MLDTVVEPGIGLAVSHWAVLRRSCDLQVAGGTWAYSLLLSSSQMARFAAPLCFNFLHVIRMNDVASGGQVGRCAGPVGGRRTGKVEEMRWRSHAVQAQMY